MREEIEKIITECYEILKNENNVEFLDNFFSIKNIEKYYMDSISFMGFCEDNEINIDIINVLDYLEENKIIHKIDSRIGISGKLYNTYLNSQIILMLLIDAEYRKSNFKKDIKEIIEENKDKLIYYNKVAINIKIIEILMKFLYSEKVRLNKKFDELNTKEFLESWLIDKLNIEYKKGFKLINDLLRIDIGFLNGYKKDFSKYSLLNRVILKEKISKEYLKYLYTAPLINIEYINQIIHLINQYILILDKRNKFSLNDILIGLKTPSGYKNCLICFGLFKNDKKTTKFTCSEECSKALKNKRKASKRKN